ncbi:MAG: SRPBCC family protein [Thermoleophilia bacterium]
MRFRKEIEVGRSVEEAFAYVADFSNAEEWDPGVVEAAKLTEGSVRLGSEFDLVALFRGKRHRFRYVVTDFDENRRIVLAAEGDRVDSVDQIALEPAGTGARITYVADLQLKGIFRLASPLLAPVVNRMGDAALEGLKTVLDRPR